MPKIVGSSDVQVYILCRKYAILDNDILNGCNFIEESTKFGICPKFCIIIACSQIMESNPHSMH